MMMTVNENVTLQKWTDIRKCDCTFFSTGMLQLIVLAACWMPYLHKTCQLFSTFLANLSVSELLYGPSPMGISVVVYFVIFLY